MPEISRFLGISIRMYRDGDPPVFMAFYLMNKSEAAKPYSSLCGLPCKV
jgi:hypothetical protein